MNPLLIFNCGSELLEGPVFDKENQLLYFVSILDFLVYCYNPKTKEMLSISLDSPVGCVFINGKKKVLAASKKGFYEIDFNTMEKKFSFQIGIEDNVRYNDGTLDSKGRILIGTMGFPEVKENIGQVYSYFKGQYKTIIENTTISNGLEFSIDNTSLYFIDTPTKKVGRYAYDLETGDVNFEEFVIEFKGKGSPDGMCKDDHGNLWIAEWGGSCISQWEASSGNKLRELELPCENITSCAFDDLGGMYVTTAKSDALNNKFEGGLFYFDNSNFD